jgi:phosphohistidine phosphatase
LTPRGEKRFALAARGLARLLPRPRVLLTSPLPRARRTAVILASAWGRLSPRDLPALVGGDFEGLARALAEQPAESLVAVVGHEPDLSSLVARLLGGGRPERMVFRKGGAALVELPGLPAEGGVLLWFAPPRVLRRLG